jgi:translocation and assembly module TamA
MAGNRNNCYPARFQALPLTRWLLQRRWFICALIPALLSLSSTTLQETFASTTLKKDLRVVINGVDGVELNNVHGFLSIWEFNAKLIESVPRLRYMHKQAPEQIQAALRPFGYYRSTVKSELVELERVWQVTYDISVRDRIPIGSSDFRILGEGIDLPEFQELQALDYFNSGQLLDQQAYEEVKQQLQSVATRLGFFEAELQQNEIRVNMDSYTAHVALVFYTGPRYKTGVVTLQEDRRWLNAELLSRFVELENPQPYDARDLQTLQSDLSSTDYYKDVRIKASVDDAVDRVIPVEVDLTHLNPRQYVFGVGYGTDTGARVKLGLTGRRINDRGHHYLAEGRLSEIGYGAVASYTIPTLDPRTDYWRLRFGLDREKSDSRNFRSVTLGGDFRYKDGLWFKTYALDYKVEEFVVDGETPVTNLLMPSVDWTRIFPEQLDKRINAVNGSSLQLLLRGASGSLLSDTSFLQPMVFAKKIKTLDNRHRVLARLGLGTTWVEDFDKLPSSLRYYTGGDRSVRGYGFQDIAPLDIEANTVGGRHLIESSIEYEIPFRESFSWALFADAGDAFDDKPDYRLGLGVGFRWRSPIGPVRIDVGRSFDNPGEGNVRLHFSLGPDL